MKNSENIINFIYHSYFAKDGVIKNLEEEKIFSWIFQMLQMSMKW